MVVVRHLRPSLYSLIVPIFNFVMLNILGRLTPLHIHVVCRIAMHRDIGVCPPPSGRSDQLQMR